MGGLKPPPSPPPPCLHPCAALFLPGVRHAFQVMQQLAIRFCTLQGGHFGSDRTQQKIAERFYWKSMWNDIKEYVRTCSVCQTTNDAKFIKKAAPLHPIHVKPEVWRQVHIYLATDTAPPPPNSFCLAKSSILYPFALCIYIGWYRSTVQIQSAWCQ